MTAPTQAQIEASANHSKWKEASDIIEKQIAALTAAAWKCKAQRTADPPQDCGWPICGCDPYADKVIAALQESGALAGLAHDV